jgi:hypothetical protein
LIREQMGFGPIVLYLGEKNVVIRFEGPITYSPSTVPFLPSVDNSGTTTSDHAGVLLCRTFCPLRPIKMLAAIAEHVWRERSPIEKRAKSRKVAG